MLPSVLFIDLYKSHDFQSDLVPIFTVTTLAWCEIQRNLLLGLQRYAIWMVFLIGTHLNTPE